MPHRSFSIKGANIAQLKTRFCLLFYTGITTMSYHYGSYQPEPHYLASLPLNFPLYRGPQDIYSYGESHGKEVHPVPDANAGFQMVPQPQYPMVQEAYHHATPRPLLPSLQSYPQLQPQHASRYVSHLLDFDATPRNAYLPQPLPLQPHGPQLQSQFAQNTYVSTVPNFDLGISDPTSHPGHGFKPNNVAVPLPSNSKRQFQSSPDTNVLDGLPPLKRLQGRFAHSNPAPRWEPKKAQTAQPRLHPQFSLSVQRKGSIKGSNRDWSTLQPGAVHILVPIVPFPSSSPLDEQYQDAATHRDPVMYLPRSSDFSGKHKDPHACISFSLDGMPGPYLLDLAEARVTIDGEDDKVFEQFGWRTTKLQIDWPGLSIPPEGFRVVDKDGLPLRRGELAAFLATCIAKMIINTQRGYALPMDQTQKLNGSTKNWDIMKVDYNHLRLISVNYYDEVWVPVLALDIAAYDV